MHNTRFFCGEHDRDVCVAHIHKIRILRLILLSVGGNRPFTEVVDLFVHIIGDVTAGVVAALRLENADGLPLSFRGPPLRVHRLHVLIEEHDGGRILHISRRRRLGRIQPPLRRWIMLVTAEQASVGRSASRQQKTSGQHAK